MYISNIKLLNFRNYSDAEIEFKKEGALFYGVNGSGKTSILEGLYFLSLGKSHRDAGKKQLIKKNKNESYISSNFVHNEYTTSISVGFSRNDKTKFKKNNLIVSSISDWLCSSSFIISFGPNDINLIYGDPSQRRKYTDSILCKTDKKYLLSLQKYIKIIRQRNAILSLKNKDYNLLNVYDDQLSICAATIIRKRNIFFKEISPLFEKNYNIISDKKDIGYIGYSGIINDIDMDEYKIKELYTSILRKNKEKDCIIGYTSSGPHRDNFICKINNKPVKYYGSQGQSRSMSLSLRLCALEYYNNISSKRGIIMIDDAFSELDEKRKINYLSLIKEQKGQIFATSLNKKSNMFPDLESIPVKKFVE